MKHKPLIALNIDTIVGPTHHFGGLSFGNVASTTHKSLKSNPKKAAIEGLKKMKLVHDLGVRQAVLPPQQRPDIEALRSLGFIGSNSSIIKDSIQQSQELLLQCCSSSFMWTANAATVSSSSDTKDGKAHIIPANLVTNFHRSIEAELTFKRLSFIFANKKLFTVHRPLPATTTLADEGSANQIRFSSDTTDKGLYLFVYGRASGEAESKQFPARQSKEAVDALVRLHQLPEEQVVIARQHQSAIDAGVFHNDVISAGCENLFSITKKPLQTQKVVRELQNKARLLFKKPLQLFPVTSKQLSVKEAVSSYIFNSQLITSGMDKLLLSPYECKSIDKVGKIIDTLFKKKAISSGFFVPLEESMKNGGGPGCLRLLLHLSEEELKGMHQGVLLTEHLFQELYSIIDNYYPVSFSLKDLADSSFRKRADMAVSKIIRLLGMPE